ncbi:ribonuclease H [Trichonephila clavipes]|nr:ribonuclease H [Trichonephila clavipes]
MLQLDEDIRIQINLEHSILNFMQEPPFPRRPPKETKITLNLLRPCSKKEDARTLKQKGLETIEKISQENCAVAYTDGSSDISFNKGGAGILFQLRNKERKMYKINTGLIASNFTSELLAIKEALILYSTHLELLGTTEGLAIFSDSRAALEAIIKGDTNITSDINVLLESMKISSENLHPLQELHRGPTNARPHPRMSGPYSAYYTAQNGATGFGATRGSLQR